MLSGGSDVPLRYARDASTDSTTQKRPPHKSQIVEYLPLPNPAAGVFSLYRVGKHEVREDIEAQHRRDGSIEQVVVKILLGSKFYE